MTRDEFILSINDQLEDYLVGYFSTLNGECQSLQMSYLRTVVNMAHIDRVVEYAEMSIRRKHW